MFSDSFLIVLTAGALGFIHTILGPDHYLPFIVLSKSRNWSIRKTTFVTILCGAGHVLSSILLGLIGITFGLALTNLEVIESFRGNIAAWLLITFGFVYMVWSIRDVLRNKSHNHSHTHNDGIVHQHEHIHIKEHSHIHLKKNSKNITPWVLFIIFILGPCEPLIPILMYPAIEESISTLIFVSITFGSVTILTMLSIVIVSVYGFRFLPFAGLKRYVHVITGITIFFCGLSIQVLGL